MWENDDNNVDQLIHDTDKLEDYKAMLTREEAIKADELFQSGASLEEIYQQFDK